MSLYLEKKKGKIDEMNDMVITSDFTCHKISVLKKALEISAIMKIGGVTIGPESVLHNNDSDKLENIENEQNSCNIKTSEKINTSPKYNTVLNSNNISFSFKKIQLEKELQRKEEVKKKMDLRIKHMQENGRATREEVANTHSLLMRERERQNLEELASILAEEERFAEQEEIKRRHVQQLHAQRAQEQKEKLEREMEEYRRRMKEKEELTKAMIVLRRQFTDKYCNIVTLCKTYRDKHAFNIVFTANNTRIKEMSQQMEALDTKIKSGELVDADVGIIQGLVCQIDDVLNIFRTETEKIAQYEAELARKAQVANEVQPVVEVGNASVGDTVPLQQLGEIDTIENKEARDQGSNVTINQETAITPSTSGVRPEATTNDPECKTESIFEYVDKESFQIYIKSRHFLELYRETCKDFLQSIATKKYRFECQRAINIPVNAISGVSEQHLRDKYDRLQNLLIGRSFPNVMQHPQGVIFCKNHLAKKIVGQGETLVSSKTEMAFPVAMIAVALWNEHMDFGELFLAHLHVVCPFIVPIFLPQQEDQSNEDYYKSLGYKYSEDGTVEKQDKFLKRMSGLMRLYASITITGQRRGVTKSHPHGLQHAWRWLAAVLNIDPRADICDLCATLILDMLEVAGNVLWTAYPKQFHKLLILLIEQYYPRMQNVAGNVGGPLMRLEEFLKNALTSGIIRPADGMLPPNFW